MIAKFLKSSKHFDKSLTASLEISTSATKHKTNWFLDNFKPRLIPGPNPIFVSGMTIFTFEYFFSIFFLIQDFLNSQ